MQESLFANRVRVGPHPQHMPFTSGSNNIQTNGTVSDKETSGLHFILVKRWVLGINLPPVTKIIFIITYQKIEFEVIKFIRYDRGVAKLLQNCT